MGAILNIYSIKSNYFY